MEKYKLASFLKFQQYFFLPVGLNKFFVRIYKQQKFFILQINKILFFFVIHSTNKQNFRGVYIKNNIFFSAHEQKIYLF